MTRWRRWLQRRRGANLADRFVDDTLAALATAAAGR